MRRPISNFYENILEVSSIACTLLPVLAKDGFPQEFVQRFRFLDNGIKRKGWEMRLKWMGRGFGPPLFVFPGSYLMESHVWWCGIGLQNNQLILLWVLDWQTDSFPIKGVLTWSELPRSHWPRKRNAANLFVLAKALPGICETVIQIFVPGWRVSGTESERGKAARNWLSGAFTWIRVT